LNFTAHRVPGAFTCAATPSACLPTGPVLPLENKYSPGAGPSAAIFVGLSKQRETEHRNHRGRRPRREQHGRCGRREHR
jgi:hypothetical protein